ncbi:hypothetical protein, partial [Alkalibacterium sp. m-11]
TKAESGRMSLRNKVKSDTARILYSKWSSDMSRRLSFLPGEVSFFISNFFSDGKLEEEKSANFFVTSNRRNRRHSTNES